MTTHKTPTPREAAAQRKLHANAERAKNRQGQTTGANPVEALNNFEAKHNLQPKLKAPLFAENLADIQAATPNIARKSNESHNQNSPDLVLPLIVCLTCFLFIKKIYSLNKNNIIGNNAALASIATSAILPSIMSPLAGLTGALLAATAIHSINSSEAATSPAHSRTSSEAATSPAHSRTSSEAATAPAHSMISSEPATSPAHSMISSEAATSPAHSRSSSEAGSAQQHNHRQLTGQNSTGRGL
jgi:hypothetical protein